MSSNANKPVVLAIAGADPSGGAGIIADIRTIQAFSCIPAAAITSITFQNSQEYFGALHQTAASVRAQIEAIVGEHEIAAVKIGMLPTADVVREVARSLHDFNLPPPVIDPVIESTSGGKLMQDDAFEVLVTELLPRARLVTPNIPEAEKLAGVNIGDEEQMRQAAARIRELGVRSVLVKGGHLKMQRSEVSDQRSVTIDILDDDGIVTRFEGERISGELRGSGCILSSAIASGIAKGLALADSISEAKAFVTNAFRGQV
jgi:hydroxymethylpyrimidine kinase/phosphomethylpyrimidine kinase